MLILFCSVVFQEQALYIEEILKQFFPPSFLFPVYLMGSLVHYFVHERWFPSVSCSYVQCSDLLLSVGNFTCCTQLSKTHSEIQTYKQKGKNLTNSYR